MSNILPFEKRTQSATFSLEAEKQALAVYLKRLARSGETLVQYSHFKLEDQILTHALVASGVSFAMQAADARPDSSIGKITLDRYGLTVMESDAVSPDTMILQAKDLLAHWRVEVLVQYALDHEVPIEPLDIVSVSKVA